MDQPSSQSKPVEDKFKKKEFIKKTSRNMKVPITTKETNPTKVQNAITTKIIKEAITERENKTIEAINKMTGMIAMMIENDKERREEETKKRIEDKQRRNDKERRRREDDEEKIQKITKEKESIEKSAKKPKKQRRK